MTMTPCLQESLNADFPLPARSTLEAILADPAFPAYLTAAQLAQVAGELGVQIDDLLGMLVPLATCFADPPISGFNVGVVVLGATYGNAYFGANREFPGAALSFTVHGEQSATANAWANGEQGLTAIAISAAPCGYCRQFLYELTTAQTLTVLLPKQPPMPLTSLLPDAFGPNDLCVTAALMTPEDHGYVVQGGSSDPVVLAALAAANASYAPYTFTYAGVAVQTMGGAIYSGRLAENAAYNPSMSPMEGALNAYGLLGDPADPLTRAVLVQAQPVGNPIPSQIGATQVVVDTYGGVLPLETYAAVPA